MLRKEDGAPYGMVLVCRDITERKRAEEERRGLEGRLQRAEKMEALGQLAGGCLPCSDAPGCRIHAVPGGEEAVAHLKGNPVDILVLDMIMEPRIDGLETYRRVREINPHQKAIIVSGFSDTERIREAQKLGAGARIRKPNTMGKIGRAIRDELIRQSA